MTQVPGIGIFIVDCIPFLRLWHQLQNAWAAGRFPYFLIPIPPFRLNVCVDDFQELLGPLSSVLPALFRRTMAAYIFASS